MLIKDIEKYTESLVTLWHKVFGDDEDYIRLFFRDACYDSECFAELEGDEVISAFYLLKCRIKCDGKAYNGRYLYAAATLPEYRGKGLMSKLIEEAKAYAEAEKLDFIALVPANDGLYGYYEAFGFVEGMYKYRLNIKKDTATMRAYREISDSDEFSKIRSSADCNMLVYNDVCNKYAFDCLRYYGTRLFYLNDNAYYAEGEELLCNDRDVAMNLINNLTEESVIYTNCLLGNSEKVRNGMIYYLNDEIKNKEIYMNIALD
jgi:GNAT superfamily N-acetyltransferase